MNALVAHGLVRELHYGKRILVVTQDVSTSLAVFEGLVSTFHEDAPKYGWGDLDKTVSMPAGYQMHKGDGFVAVRASHQIKHAWRGRTLDYLVFNRVGDTFQGPAFIELAPTLSHGTPGSVIETW